MNKLYIFICLILISKLSLAGQGTGNGGDVLVCKNESDEIISVELYDYFEAKEKRTSFSLETGDPELDYIGKVKFVLEKVRRLDPNRANLYEKWFKEFLDKSVTSFTNKELSDIPDTGEVLIPQGCEIVQIAHQNEPLPGEYRYIIRKDLWELMDEANKAGLVLHELIYREAKYDNSLVHNNSRRVRYFNSTISSRHISRLSWSEYLYLLRGIIFYFLKHPIKIIWFISLKQNIIQAFVIIETEWIFITL